MGFFYDEISKGYDELHGNEQKSKLALLRTIINPKKGEKLLDVGCGTGISSSGFMCDVYGIDPSNKLLDIYKEKVKGKDNFFLETGRAEDLSYEDEFFDYVISLTAIQNFDDLTQGLSEMKRVGKNKWVFSFLKGSPRRGIILGSIKTIFYDKKIEQIEENKDLFVIIS